MRNKIIFLALILSMACDFALGSEIYSRVYDKLAEQNHRLPGSANFINAASMIEEELKKTGLEVFHETFDAIVPRTEFCVLKIDGREIGPVYPVANGAAPLVTDGVISGSLIWGGEGKHEDLDGKNIKDSIVLIDLGAQNAKSAMINVFEAGAKALIYVGNDSANQWNIADADINGIVNVPRLYIPREVAEREGLLSAKGEITAEFEAKVVLEDVVGRNIWTVIPGKTDKQFRLGAEEIIILSATLDTSGFIPDYSPQTRSAANAALLAQTTANLAEKYRDQAPDRTIIVVFFGSRYAAQEGARYFYYALNASYIRDEDSESLRSREARYVNELKITETLFEACERDNVFLGQDSAGHQLYSIIREVTVARVNNANSMLSNYRLRIASSRKDIRDETRGENRREIIDEHEKIINETEILQVALNEKKRLWNSLREHILQRTIPEEQVLRETLDDILFEVKSNLTAQKKYVERLIGHFGTFKELSKHAGGRQVAAHFDLDFAEADKPWMFGVSGAADTTTSEAIAPGLFFLHLRNLGIIYTRASEKIHWPAPLLEEALSPHFKMFSLATPGQRIVPSAIAFPMGIAGYQMMTAGNPLSCDEMPQRNEFNLANLAAPLSILFEEMIAAEELSLRPPRTKAIFDTRMTYMMINENNYAQKRCVNYARASEDIEGAARDAVLMVYPSHLITIGPGSRVNTGMSRAAWARVNASGYFFIPMLNRDITRSGNTLFLGVGFDEKGKVERISDKAKTTGASGGNRIPLFYGYGGAAFSFGTGLDLVGAGDVLESRKLDARTDGEFTVTSSLNINPLENFFTDRNAHIKHIGTRGDMILGSTANKPMGEGIPIDNYFLLRMNGTAQQARDYWLLNESRLRALRTRNIFNDALESLHDEARVHISSSDENTKKLNYSIAKAHDIAAAAIGYRIHAPLKGIAADLVKAVIVLLLLNIPFAFVMERLIFGFTSIYKQVMGFTMFFVGTFLVLFFTHPAFSLASAPTIIFLAFVIILLSGIVVHLLMTKIKQEIRALQGLASTAHGITSDSNTGMAAMLIGISGMRNRPLKTFLTAGTVLLLTFTILVFASFTAQLGVVDAYLGQGRGEDRIEANRFSLLDIPKPFLDMFSNLYGETFHVFERGGLFRNPTRSTDSGSTPISPEIVVYNPANGKTSGLGALMGFDRREVELSDIIRNIVPGFSDEREFPPLYLAENIAERLEIEQGGELKIMGRSFAFAGNIVPGAINAARTIEGRRITPPDFVVTLQNIGRDGGSEAKVSELEQADVNSFETFPTERVGITSLDTLEDGFPYLFNRNMIILYPRDDTADIQRTARRMAEVFQGAVYSTTATGAHRHFFTKAVTGSGFGDVIVPLILGGLIIFSSLMGSIVDRKKEIFTYSAMGLSPPDVGALFFAESAAYSVIGGMGGYLLSQVVAKILAVLGSYKIIQPPEMNFSSLTSVLTILIVMAVVMLSTIYPAISAGRSANPGVARKWKMPAPRGNHLNFVFPFTVSKADFAGILSFIKEHFENHGDTALGEFAARDMELFSMEVDGNITPGISAIISLAPFDLGVSQKFKMYSKEFEIKGIEEVVIEIERLGGAPTTWIRGNKIFAGDLRQQFLLWRSLPIAAIEHYRKQTNDYMKQKN